MLSALLLLGSPWIFGFASRVMLPHLIIGLTEIIVVRLSSSKAPLRFAAY